MLPAATVQRQRSCLAKAPGGPPRQRQPQTRAEFAFVLQALAFTPCTLGTKLVAQGLSPLRHLPDLGEVGDVAGKHQLGEDERGGQQSVCLQHTSTPVSVSGDSWRARAEPDRVPANCCQGTACGQRCCHSPRDSACHQQKAHLWPGTMHERYCHCRQEPGHTSGCAAPLSPWVLCHPTLDKDPLHPTWHPATTGCPAAL